MLKKLWNTLFPVHSNNSAILKERDATPSHYLLRIEFFSELSEDLLDDCISNEFEAGGYQWKLVIWPKGDEWNNVNDHISLELQVADACLLPVGWEINAIFNFFVYDHFQDKYVCLQDAMERRFHAMRPGWGVPKFMDLKTFTSPSKGYVFNDKCIFGVEVFIIKNTFTGECLQMRGEFRRTCNYSWKFNDIAIEDGISYRSDTFICADYKWRILFKPKGHAFGKGRDISIGLVLDTLTLPPNTKLLVNYMFRLLDQSVCKKHHEDIGSMEFSPPSIVEYCTPEDQNTCAFIISDFMSLTKFQDSEKGYLINNSCIIQVELDVIAIKTPDFIIEY